MILSIHIKNGFRHKDVVYDFAKGLTSITGQNESGKSLIMEFIRYALWGTAALRGSAGDYKKLEVILNFIVKGTQYRVYRGKGSASLWKVIDDDTTEDLAIGTTPVNGAIKNLFGYDMLVFDVANSCNQGAIEALGQMRPGDRKKMVDQTIGLQFIDGIIEWANGEATSAKRSADSLALAVANVPTPPEDPMLVKPSEIELPADFEDPATLRVKLGQVQKLKQERDTLTGAVGQKLIPPVEPGPCPVAESEAQLLDLARDRERIKNTIQAHQASLDRIPPPPMYSLEAIDQMEEQIKGHALWCQKKSLLDKGSLTCPSCNHSWPLMAEGLSSLQDVVEVEAPPKGVTLTSIQQWRNVLAQQARREPLEKEIADANQALVSLPDRSADLSIRRDHDSSVRSYERLLASYNQHVVSQQGQRKRLAEIEQHGDLELSIANLLQSIEANARLQSARAASLEAISNYDRQVKFFEQQKANYETQKKQHSDLVEKWNSEKEVAEGMIAGREALKELKVKIKKFLVPSLNSVASQLIAKMTGGKRSSIKVDEDFNIQVDGQELATLSGSGKAVANLAIRLGLGQVLTNKVFPVFMADEIDESMDAERSGLTAECLAELAKELDQVILISHKKPAADHYIEL